MPIPLLIVDDLRAPFQFAEQLAWPASGFSYYPTPRGLITGEDELKRLIGWFTSTGSPDTSEASVSALADPVPTELAVILDLGYRLGISLEQDWLSVVDAIRIYPQSTITVDRSLHDGFAVVAAMIRCQSLRRAVILIASSRAFDGLTKTVENVNNWLRERNREIFLVPAPHGVTAHEQLADLEGLLSVLGREWNTRFPDYHPDSMVNSVLKVYGDLWDVRKKHVHRPWTHTEIQEVAAYRNELSRFLDCEVGEESAKGLGMVEYSNDQPHWHSTMPSRIIAGEVFSRTLAHCGIEGVVVQDTWRLPIMPGFPFLLSLRELLVTLKNEGAGHESVRFEQFVSSKTSRGKAVFRATIKLAGARTLDGISEALGPLDHAIGFLKKVQISKTGIPDGGLAEAIWNLTRCKTARIVDAERSPWLKLFRDGSACPAVLVSFAEYELSLVW